MNLNPKLKCQKKQIIGEFNHSKNFLEKLKPINKDEEDEWKEILDEYSDEFPQKEPVLFWYPSSGCDMKALVHFNEKDTIVKLNYYQTR